MTPRWRQISGCWIWRFANAGSLLAEPTDGQFVRYQAAAQYGHQLLLAVETGPLQQQHGRSLLLLTDLSVQQLRWQQQSFVLDKKHQLRTLAQLGSRQLLVAEQPWTACGSQLFSLSAAGLVAIALDGVTLCAVAASKETGQLALSVSKNWQRADEARPEQVWLLSPEFFYSVYQNRAIHLFVAGAAAPTLPV